MGRTLIAVEYLCIGIIFLSKFDGCLQFYHLTRDIMISIDKVDINIWEHQS